MEVDRTDSELRCFLGEGGFLDKRSEWRRKWGRPLQLFRVQDGALQKLERAGGEVTGQLPLADASIALLESNDFSVRAGGAGGGAGGTVWYLRASSVLVRQKWTSALVLLCSELGASRAPQIAAPAPAAPPAQAAPSVAAARPRVAHSHSGASDDLEEQEQLAAALSASMGTQTTQQPRPTISLLHPSSAGMRTDSDTARALQADFDTEVAMALSQHGGGAAAAEEGGAGLAAAAAAAAAAGAAGAAAAAPAPTPAPALPPSPRAAFECSLCYDDLPVHEGITLDCDHRFCWNCVGQHAATKISERQVTADKLCCPLPACSGPLTVHNLMGCQQRGTLVSALAVARLVEAGALSRAVLAEAEGLCGGAAANRRDRERLQAESRLVLARFERFLLEKNYPHLKHCPKCEAGPYDASDVGAIIACTKCRACFCKSCGKDHDEATSCAAHTQWERENGLGDAAAHALLEREGTKCPACSHITWGVIDCDHVSCANPAGCRLDRATDGAVGGFCVKCLAERKPIMRHGNHYHLASCAYYVDCCAETCMKKGKVHCKDDKKDAGCPACTKLGRLCDPPPADDSLGIRELKARLDELGVDHQTCLEKGDLLQLLAAKRRSS